jgi:glucose/arabinose dehydrogenase
MNEVRPAPGLGGQLAWLVLVCLVVAGGATGAALFLGPADPVSSSRVATDRPCPEVPDEPTPPLEGARIAAVRVGSAEAPTSLALHPGSRGSGVLGERAGRLREVTDGQVTDHVVLDLAADTTDDGDGGLLAVAYDPDGRWLYVYRATKDRDDVLMAYPVDDAGRPRPDAGRQILRVDHPPSQQHHGGSLVFGPDGMLYIGFGDGGGLGDPGEHAQDPTTLLGKILRIDPTPADDRPYAVPRDNPFVDRYGWRPEIWVLGVRNPFRLGLDDASGDLWLGDVGQSCWEEIDRLPTTGDDDAAGANLGWDRLEGTAVFEGGEVPGGALEPVVTVAHRSGWCAIVAGYVPRDSAVTILDGWLLVTDYCAGRVVAVRPGEGADGTAEQRDLGVRVKNPIAVVEGPAGRPWILTLDGAVLELRDVRQT